ncbi:MAG: alpha-mannosidase [Lachnospiraceae bacterium]|jgi:alpha-mannosidase
MQPEWKSRLDHWIHTLKQDFYEPLGEIDFQGFLTFDQLSVQQAMDRTDYVPMPAGTRWGEEWQYAWMRGEIVLPEKAKGHRIVMNLDPGGESTLFVNGQEFGACRAAWVNIPHHFYVDQTLSEDGTPGERFEIMAEVYGGHFIPQSPLGGCSTGPVRPGDYLPPDPKQPRTCVGVSTFGIWHETAYQLWLDVQMLREIMEMGDQNSLRTQKIEEALQQFTLTVDFEQSLEGRLKDYKTAREQLRPLMDAHNGSTAPDIYAIGNAHLDVAWLWPLQETERKTARTFAQQLRLMEEYPEYKFLQSQPHLYWMCMQRYPKLYEKIKQKIREGQWIADGAMWVEPDTNMTSGESLIRQLVHGKKFYQQEFGVDCRLLWLPDTFGYTAALPQILKGCGVDYLTTQKIFWNYNGSDPFPYHYFTWQGMDGSEIKSFLHMEYESKVNAATIIDKWNHRVQRKNMDAFLLPFGYGDGGGGPTRDDVEQILREKDIEGVPKVHFDSPVVFFHDMEKKHLPENRYVGELYFQCHRGTYTTQASVKWGNRKSELSLRETEFWASAASALKQEKYPLAQLDTLWKDVLLNQFHDILPGSSIARVYEEASKLYEQVLSQSSELVHHARSAFPYAKDGITVYNSLSWDRRALVQLPKEYRQGAQDSLGNNIPTQPNEQGTIALVTVPSCGFTSLTPYAAEKPEQLVTVTQTPDGVVLENRLIRVVINAAGEISSLLDKETGHQRISGSANVMKMFKDVPRKFDAWDIDSMYELSPVELSQDTEQKIVLEGPLKCSVSVTRKLHDSMMTQVISLEAESRRVDFETEIQWNELHKLLKVSFPTGIRAEQAYNEMQFGYVERPTHRSRPYDADRFEVCNHRYTALCDQNQGAAVLNESKYGVSMMGDAIELTLLRAATCPEMAADNGLHHFTYSYYVYNGSFLESDVVRQGYELNVPAGIEAGNSGTLSLFSVSCPNVILETVKAAEDGSGDLIVRLYESKRADTDAIVTINLPYESVVLCDMMENPVEEINSNDHQVALHFHTFEVKTLRIHL